MVGDDEDDEPVAPGDASPMMNIEDEEEEMTEEEAAEYEIWKRHKPLIEQKIVMYAKMGGTLAQNRKQKRLEFCRAAHELTTIQLREDHSTTNLDVLNFDFKNTYDQYKAITVSLNLVNQKTDRWRLLNMNPREIQTQTERDDYEEKLASISNRITKTESEFPQIRDFLIKMARRLHNEQEKE